MTPLCWCSTVGCDSPKVVPLVRDYGTVDREVPRQLHFFRPKTGLTVCGLPMVKLPDRDPNVWPICEDCRSFYEVRLPR